MVVASSSPLRLRAFVKSRASSFQDLWHRSSCGNVWVFGSSHQKRGKSRLVKDTGHKKNADKKFVFGGVVLEVGVHCRGFAAFPPLALRSLCVSS